MITNHFLMTLGHISVFFYVMHERLAWLLIMFLQHSSLFTLLQLVQLCQMAIFMEVFMVE